MTVPLGNPYALGAGPTVQTSARTDRLAIGASFHPSAAALGAVSGFLYGPPGTMGDLTLLTDILLRVDPFLAVIQGTHNTQQGQYVVPNVQSRDIAVPAKDASLFRRALLVVRVADSFEAGVATSATTDGAWLELLPGPLAASNPQLPSLAAYGNYLLAGEVTIPSTASGQPVTLTRYSPRTTARGGVLPVLNDSSTVTGHAGALPLYDGHPRWHPVYGLQFGIGGTWRGGGGVTPPVRLSVAAGWVHYTDYPANVNLGEPLTITELGGGEVHIRGAVSPQSSIGSLGAVTVVNAGGIPAHLRPQKIVSRIGIVSGATNVRNAAYPDGALQVNGIGQAVAAGGYVIFDHRYNVNNAPA